MERYLVESPHTPEECKHVITGVYTQGFLYNCDWGCMGGVHKSWVIIEAEDAKQAMLVVPAVLRKHATATKLVKFEPATVAQWKELVPGDVPRQP